MPIFRVKSVKIYTGQKNLHEYTRGYRDKYQVCPLTASFSWFLLVCAKNRCFGSKNTILSPFWVKIFTFAYGQGRGPPLTSMKHENPIFRCFLHHIFTTKLHILKKESKPSFKIGWRAADMFLRHFSKNRCSSSLELRPVVISGGTFINHLSPLSTFLLLMLCVVRTILCSFLADERNFWDEV